MVISFVVSMTMRPTGARGHPYNNNSLSTTLSGIMTPSPKFQQQQSYIHSACRYCADKTQNVDRRQGRSVAVTNGPYVRHVSQRVHMVTVAK